MAKDKELSYFEKLNITSLSIESIKTLIKRNIKNTKLAWDKGKNVDKQCFHIIGPAGVGKTDIMKQISSELSEDLKIKFDTIIVKAPVLSRDDMMLPFPTIENGSKSFEMLYSDFFPKGEDSFGLFVIDECSRGDHAFQQLMWQVQNEYAIHMKKFPKGWFVVSLDNPDEKEYSMDMFEDAAGLRRQLHIYVDVSISDFISYANKMGFHKHVIDFCQTYGEYLYDFDSQKSGSVYANPASWEKMSDHLIKYEQETEKIESKDYDEIEWLASGLLNISMARRFMSFVKDRNSHISPRDIFVNYPKVKAQIKKYVDISDNAFISELVNSLCVYLSGERPKYFKVNAMNITNFLTEIPIDTSVLFAMYIDNFKNSTEEKKYLLLLNMELCSVSQPYRELYCEKLANMIGG
jgi:hypothetical protein